MTPETAGLLGLVQGVTEFLPISSTGHLVLARSVLELSGGHALAFDAVLHLATATAVVVYFRREVFRLVNTFVRYVGRMPVDQTELALLGALLVGTVPAVIAGLLLEDLMETLFRTPLLVAGVLVAGSLFFIIAERQYRATDRVRTVTIRTGLLVGLFQTLALLPGFSRSGATIAGGMLLGLSREDATRFGFLLAVPVLLGAGSKKVLELLGAGGEVPWTAVGVGALVAFLSGLVAIRFMLRFLRTRTLWPFVWYRLALAAAVVLFVLVS